MAKINGSLKVNKALVDSGAYQQSDFQDTPQTAPVVSNSRPGSVTSRQVSKDQYDAMLKSQKATQEAKYLKYKQGGYK